MKINYVSIYYPGFTSGRDTWLPVHPNYWLKNVRTQEQDPKSHLNIFKRLVALRKSPVITHGDFETYAPKTWVYMITRYESEEPTKLIFINTLFVDMPRQLLLITIGSLTPCIFIFGNSSLQRSTGPILMISTAGDR